MEAEQVLKWFNSHSSAPCEVEVCLGEEDEVDEEEAAAMIKEDEDYEEEEEEDDDDEEDDIWLPRTLWALEMLSFWNGFGGGI